MCDCPSKHVFIVKDDGEYSSASDFDEDTLALLAADHVGNDDHPEEHISTSDVDHYESGAKSATHIVSNKVHHQRTILLLDHQSWELQQLS
jgi:hypothetical protein